MLPYLKLAAKYAVSKSKNDERTYLLGAIGIREDGAIVHSKNEAVFDTFTAQTGDEVYRKIPHAHAEARLAKKLGFSATVYVARVAKGTRELAMARPCEICQNILRAYRVKRVFYTISPNRWGMLDMIKNIDTYYGK